VGEGVGGRGVGEVVGGDVDGLDGGDGALVGGADAFLEVAHFGGEGGLVAHGGGHAAEEGGDLGAGLAEAEDVVDEEEHVLAHFVAEVFGHGEGGEGDAETGSGRFVHLAEDEGGLAFALDGADDAGLVHFEPEVVAFAGALADAGEDGVAAVFLGDVGDEFHDDDGLADAGAAEEADLAALGVGGEEVDDLDAGFEDGVGGEGVFEERTFAVDGPALFGVGEVAAVVEGFAEEVEDVAEDLFADGDGDGPAGIDAFHAADEAVGGAHADAADGVAADVLGDFAGEQGAVGALDGDGVEDGGELAGLEFHVDGGANDLLDFSNVHRLFLCVGSLLG
jgi:hypothetical protein